MILPEEVIEEVRNSCDIVDVISEYVTLKKRGKNYVGLCPFHNEKTPSFTVTPEKQMFYCFGCGIGGNVYTFIMKRENISFPEAVKFLANRVGITLQLEGKGDSLEKFKVKQILYDIHRDAANYFHANLINSDSGRHALEYLLKRGLDEAIIKKFGLGYSFPGWDEMKSHLKSKGYLEELLEKAGLIIRGKAGSSFYDRFRDRIMFPITDVMGRVIGFGGRILREANFQPKYLNSPDTVIYNKRQNLYGLNSAKTESNKKGIIIVEGYMDVIALHQKGFTNAVASLGTSLTTEQAKLVKRYTEEVYIAYDSDTAGRSATLRGLDILNEAGLNVKVIEFPKGLDPDDFIRKNGREGFLERINNALPLMDYKIKIFKEGIDLSSPVEKGKYASKIIPHLLKLRNQVEKEGYIRKISNLLGVSEEALRGEIEKYSKKIVADNVINHKNVNKRHNNKDNKRFSIIPAYINAEWDLINIILLDKKTFKSVSQELNYSDFNDNLNKEIAKTIYNLMKARETLSPADVIDHLEGDEYIKRFSQIVAKEKNYRDLEKTALDCIKKIKEYKLQQELECIQKQIKQYENSMEEAKLRELLLTYQDLLKKKKELRM